MNIEDIFHLLSTAVVAISSRERIEVTSEERIVKATTTRLLNGKALSRDECVNMYLLLSRYKVLERQG